MSKQVKETTKNNSVFKTLSAINVSDKTDKKNNLTYLSWAWAWGTVKGIYPDATYKVIETVHADGVSKPYFHDLDLGYMVRTEVTIEGETIPMQLPVLDGANKAMKNEAYTYRTKFGEKSVEKASMFDINTAIMRCLTKNIAMHGLGFYIYAGEDLPEVEKEVGRISPETAPQAKAPTKPYFSKTDPLFKTVVEALKSGERTVKDVEAKWTLSKAMKEELLKYQNSK